MTVHFMRDLDQITRQLLTLGSMVEDAVNRAIIALFDRRADLAKQVREGDRSIDSRETEIEEDVLKLLAMHHPVADDLRYVLAVLKVNHVLESIGDAAKRIADLAGFLASRPGIDMPTGLRDMAENARAMVRKSLDCLVNQDTTLARQVCEMDDTVDEANDSIHEHLTLQIVNDGAQAPTTLALMAVSRHFERMADLATNIAKDVIFTVEGEVVRHKMKRSRPHADASAVAN